MEERLNRIDGGRYASILFDLDGTLTNPRIGITRSVQYALGKLGIIVEDPNDLTVYIGPPLRASFKEFHGLSDDEAGTALKLYREYFEKTGLYENEDYDGIDSLLDLLRSNGRTLFVATSKPRVYAEKILRNFRLDRHFTAIEGSELDETRSNKAELIAYMLEKHRMERTTAVMVGDRSHDVAGARSNGMDSIGVEYGFGSRRELEDAGATHVVGSIGELGDLLGV